MEESGKKVGPVLKLVLRSFSGKTAKPNEVVEALLGIQGEALTQCKIVKVE
jgi:hypothetical protein